MVPRSSPEIGESISMNRQRSKKENNSRREEVVATGEALRLVRCFRFLLTKFVCLMDMLPL